MLTLKSDQVSEIAQHSFEHRLVEVLAAGDQSAFVELSSPSGLVALREVLARAEGHGLTTELELTQFAIAAWHLGADFDERFPAMDEILADPALSPAERAEAIEQVCIAVLEELEADVERGADPPFDKVGPAP